MGDIERANIDTMHRLQNPFCGSTKLLLSSQINPHLSRNTENLQNFGFDCSSGGGKRVGMPPSHPPIPPYSNIPGARLGSHNSSRGSLHSRSLSQPLFFLNDSLPPLSPSLYQKPTSPSNGGENVNVNVSSGGLMGSCDGKGNSLHITEGLPPRKVHRRSSSDVPFGFDSIMQSSPSSIPVSHTRGRCSFERTLSGGGNPTQLVKKEFGSDKNVDCNVDGQVVDDFLSAFINMDSIDAMNSSRADNNTGIENRDDMCSHASGSKRNGCDSSDNEAESSVKVVFSGERKRSATSELAPTARHYRSVSMDSFMGSMSFGDESTKLPSSSSTGVGQLFLKDTGNNANEFNLEFGHGDFTVAEMKKIMANEKLAEIAASDPKRVKRILANRQSAARSKERKTRYISELEHKVQTLQNEATTLSAQLTLIQRDSARLTSQNNELKFRLQAIERQAQLQEALSEALTAEVQHLKIGTGELNQTTMSKFFGQQLHINPQMFQQQQKQQQFSQNNANQEHQKANDSTNESPMKNEST